MQELFGAEIAMRVFNSAQAAGGRLRAVTFSLHAFDNSETCDLVRTSPLIHNTIQLFFSPLAFTAFISEDRSVHTQHTYLEDCH